MFASIKKMLLVLAVLVFGVAPAMAKGPQNVRFTQHNFSKNNTGWGWASDNEEAICIFCHTPHGGMLENAVWLSNRFLTEGAYDLRGQTGEAGQHWTYYNSATLTAEARDVTRPINEESLMCLSCHDGSISVNRIINESNRTKGTPSIGAGDRAIFDANVWDGEVYGPLIGASKGNEAGPGRLEDDHPVSFSYVNAEADPSETGLVNPTTLWNNQLNNVEGPYFYGTSAEMRVECPTCHDPHVAYDSALGAGAGEYDTAYAPFLIMPNDQSKMCLTCHIK